MIFPYDPNQPVLTFDDLRLTRITQQQPTRCATINEYAAAAGVDAGRILELFAAPLERGDLDIEAVGGEIFVNTAPHGRPTPPHHGQIPPNLWELLRRQHQPEAAYTLWRITRDLQAGGWNVQADPRHLPGIGGHSALLGLHVGRNVVPILILPDADELAAANGTLTRVEATGAHLCALTCQTRHLDRTVTAVRRWMLTRPEPALDVLVLEAPRYQPVLLSAEDGGLTPRSVTNLLPAPPDIPTGTTPPGLPGT